MACFTGLRCGYEFENGQKCPYPKDHDAHAPGGYGFEDHDFQPTCPKCGDKTSVVHPGIFPDFISCTDGDCGWNEHSCEPLNCENEGFD